MSDQTPAAEGREFASFWHGPTESVRLRLPRVVSEGGRRPAPLQLRFAARCPGGRRGLRTPAWCARQIPRPRYIVNGRPSIADLLRHVSLQDDPDDRLLLGRHRHDLPDHTLRSPPRAYVFCRQADAVSTCSSTTPCYGCRHRNLLSPNSSRPPRAPRRRPDMGYLGPFLLTPVLTKYRLYRQRARPACLLSDRAGTVLEAFPAELPDRVAESSKARRVLHLGAKRSLERLRLRFCPPAGLLSPRCFPCGRRPRPLRPHLRRRRSPPT